MFPDDIHVAAAISLVLRGQPLKDAVYIMAAGRDEYVVYSTIVCVECHVHVCMCACVKLYDCVYKSNHYALLSPIFGILN